MTTVLITGATDGIGRALAQHYSAAGARVVGIGRRPVEAAPPGVFPPAAYGQIDLAQPDAAEAVNNLLHVLGIDQIDVLIHNAALGWYGPVAEQPPASVNELLAVNLRAPVALTHALLPRLAAARGAVAFVSSVHAALPAPEFAVYTASKAALDGFARSLRIELAGRGVSIRFVQADLSQPADVARLASELCAGPPIDLLIHNAGINCVGPFAASDLLAQQRVLAVNLAAPLQLTTALLVAGKVAPGGSLVFISSLSRLLSYPGAAVYAASKDGLASYARSLAVALAQQGIHVLTVYPGPTRTAHARRYSPDNSREARRMPPDVVAAAVVRAVQRRRRVLVPGAGNQVFAGVGRWWPQIGEWAMRKTIWEKLEKV